MGEEEFTLAPRPLETQTLRELFDASRHLSQELAEHLEQNFAHSIHDVERALRAGAKKSANRNVGDVAAHNVVSKALDSHAYADELSENLSRALRLIYEKAEAEIAAESV